MVAVTAISVLGILPGGTQSVPTDPGHSPTKAAPVFVPPEKKLVAAPWRKYCGRGQQPDAPEVCFTYRRITQENGSPVVEVVLIEPDGLAKIFRVEIFRVSQQRLAQLIIDQRPPLSVPYAKCFEKTATCLADYAATTELIEALKTARELTVLGVDPAGATFAFGVPMDDFRTVVEGPPIDPKVLEEQQKQLDKELERREGPRLPAQRIVP